MSTNLNYKQVANVTRRTWDAETYEKKAKARLESSATSADGHHNTKQSQTSTGKPGSSLAPSSLEEAEKEEFLPAESGAVGPEGSERAFLKARTAKVDLESKVGTSEIISAEAAATIRLYDSKDDGVDQSANDRSVVKTGVGWHCRVCDCFLKDSHTYLDHINGRKHQRTLGYSMRVERSSKEQLLSKLNDLSKKKEQEEEERRRKGGSELAGFMDYAEVVKAKDEEVQRRKEERRQKRLERKKKQEELQEENVTEPEEEMPLEAGGEEENQQDDEIEEQVDPALAAMMGFTGFGGGAVGKKR
jgi:U4/U6.U5 tri-snRNP component SNU23